MAPSVIYDDTNLKASDLHIILQAVNLGTDQIKVIVDNYVDWYGLLDDDIDSQYNFLKGKIRYQHAQKVKFIRYKVIFENLSMYDIANYKLKESELTKYVSDINNDIRSGTKKLPLSSDHIGKASDVSSQNDMSDIIKLLVESRTDVLKACQTTANPTPYIPPHKKVITNFYNLQVDNINTGDLMKNVNVTCDSMESFLTFYRTIYYQFKNYNVMIRSPDTVDHEHFSEPSGILTKKDVHQCLQNTIYSFLSKDGVFTNFPSGRAALSRTNDGYKVLNILLAQTHPKMIDVWACEKQKPKYSEHNDLEAYCKAVLNYVELEKFSGRTYHKIEETRMFLSNLDSPHLKPIANALKQELRGLAYDTDDISPNMQILMLPGTITNHHLYSTSASTSSTPNAINTQHNQVNSLSSTTDQVDLDNFIINAFSNFNTSRKNINNKYQSPSAVRFNRT